MKKVMMSVAMLLLLVPAQAAEPDFSNVEIATTPLGEGLAMLVGQGGNIVVSTGVDGPVIVDDQFAPLVPKIEAAVKKLQDAPVRFVINTHHHADHTGGNEAFGNAGAIIFAHDNVRARLSTEQFSKLMNRTTPASPKAALPVVTFDDGVTLHWNGETIRVEHVAPAHTDGDSHVWFERANAVHMGDTFVNGTFPRVDIDGGGTLAGLIASAERVLARINGEPVSFLVMVLSPTAATCRSSMTCWWTSAAGSGRVSRAASPWRLILRASHWPISMRSMAMAS